MIKKDRIPDLTFYEWSILRWTTSDTRNELDALGIGIYRELIDRCYAQGSIPKEPASQAKIAKCSVEELGNYWPLLKHNFRVIKKQPDRLENPPATVYRSNYFRYLKRQKSNRSKKEPVKAVALNGIEHSGSNQDDTKRDNMTLNDTKRHDTKRDNTTAAAAVEVVAPNQTPRRFGEWQLAGEAIAEFFPEINFPFVLDIAQRATVAMLEIESPKFKLTDEILAKAVQRVYKPDQHSAALFRTTVPNCIGNWAKIGVTEKPEWQSPTSVKYTAQEQALQRARKAIEEGDHY